MPKNKKRIDKKNAITFKLVSRGQHDPLVVDETAPQHVLVEQDDGKRKEEQIKYGVYFDDDYDYLQHLKDVRVVESDLQQVEYKSKLEKKILLPSSVFESNVEEEEGMLNRAALPVGPQLDWDPDVIAALDEDFDFEDPQNIIDDDFITQAGGALDPSENQEASDEEDEYSDEEEYDEDDDTLSAGSYGNERKMRLFEEEETRSHFTNYSMTSSVVKRNDGLRLLDERFETLFEKEYGEDTNIGALDCDEIEGRMNINECPLLEQMINEVENRKRLVRLDDVQHERTEYNEVDEEKEIITIDEEWKKTQKEDRFDCESILSTYSNIYNHPKLISERKVGQQKLKIDPKTGIPVGVLDRPGLTEKKLRQLDSLNNITNDDHTDLRSNYSRTSRVTELSYRPKDESKEDKKERKSQLREYRRERRTEKKANKLAFKFEEIKQNQLIVNLNNNLKSIKLK